MDDAARVGGVERVGQLEPHSIVCSTDMRRSDASRASSVPPSSSSITQERAALVLADVIERADVRMVQRRDDARFALEALERTRHRPPALRAGP